VKIAFAGTPEFARLSLEALVYAGHDVALVLTTPDRPAGRGLANRESEVKRFAIQHGLALAQPAGLRENGRHAVAADETRQLLRDIAPRVMVVAAYGLILPPALLAIPTFGCINIHASLLPRWRGAAPVERAIEAGDAKSGITIMGMEAGLDTGPVLMQAAVPIGVDDTGPELTLRLARRGAQLIVEAMARLEGGALVAVPQAVEGVTYAVKITPAEAHLDWREPAQRLARKVRAFQGQPGAYACLGEATIKFWQAHDREGVGATPGTVLSSGAAGLEIACTPGSLIVTELQRAGGKRLPVAEFLRGMPLPVGTILQ